MAAAEQTATLRPAFGPSFPVSARTVSIGTENVLIRAVSTENCCANRFWRDVPRDVAQP